MKSSSPLTDLALRLALTGAHHAMKLLRLVRPRRRFGAHALARTPENRIILVKLRYAPGWRLPGGGRSEDEDPKAAVLRELREEIGMTAHGEVRLACELDESADFTRDVAALFIVDGVRYAPPRWSWEIEQVREVPFDELPPDMSPRAAQWIDAIRAHL